MPRPNILENDIIQILSSNYPLKVKDIHKELLSQSKKQSYKYTYKTVKRLVEQEILTQSPKGYKISDAYITKLRDLSTTISKNYNLGLNVFTSTIPLELITVFDNKKRDKVSKELQEVLEKASMKMLDEWFSAHYDPLEEEFTRLSTLVDFKDKKVLEIGFGTGRITAKIAKLAKKVIAIDKEKSFVTYCNKKFKRKNINFLQMDISELSKLKTTFDVIFLGWIGLHYSKDSLEILKNLFSLLNPGGKLVAIEAKTDSEYMEILNVLKGKDYQKINDKQMILKDQMCEIFGNIREERFDTYYEFPTFDKIEETFKIELIYEEAYVWSQKDSEKLAKFFKKRKDKRLRVGEGALILVSEKVIQ